MDTPVIAASGSVHTGNQIELIETVIRMQARPTNGSE